ncbi:hypothetical protein MKA27_17450 [[Clostridium] innocuum]|uniref:hypothetical protein n=1 Tax=Clostridium innocuum TaxID=1522 RepID=UPI000D6CD8C9|nr:hypothetical protein [[Clostridium] innocuum]MCR0315851.1 hypothetical protein [[Clostridium] innocuum]MCR0370948.1 hypothetical protein [[Clostridium] innocuum]MCR0375598.1 hypothetical protein [[Clostridium] innocuum]MCR0560924.1 hypothetical protein [[Clostridium] innocuum]MCR0603698.1 hypothetical protein [[Clostridium] innocuum]
MNKDEVLSAWNCIKGLEDYPINCTIDESQEELRTLPFNVLFKEEIAILDSFIEHIMKEDIDAK